MKHTDPADTAAEADSETRELFVDFLLRREDGETVEIDDLCAAHAERAEQLRALWADRRWLEEFFGTGADEDVERSRGGHSGKRYACREEIGRGGMGAVLRVWDDELRRELALKVALTPPGGDASPATRRAHSRFRQEAQVTAQLDHPGVVPVHELGVDDGGRPWFAMRLVRGRDLAAIAALARSGAEGWTLPRAMSVLEKVCETLAFAHEKGVVHRDLKPANVMVGRFGEVYVMDWGLARASGSGGEEDAVRTDRGEADGSSPLRTAEGAVVGTPTYLAPEVALEGARAGGPAADVYALGAMLYTLLTGELPYVRAGESAATHTVLARLARGELTPVEELASDAPPELVAVCEKAMARDPGERYGGPAAMAGDLRAWLEGRVVRAYERGPVAELRKWIGRNRALAAALLAAVLAVLGGTLAYGLRQRAAVREERRLNDELGLANAEALEARDRARRREEDVRSMANALLFDLHDRLADTLDVTTARERLVEVGLVYLAGLAEEQELDDPELTVELASAYSRFAHIQGNPFDNNLGDPEGALASYERSLELLQGLLARDPDRVRTRVEIAARELWIGEVLEASGGVEDALSAFQRCLDHLELSRAAATAERSGTLSAMVVDHGLRARTGRGRVLLASDRPEAAVEALREAVEQGERALADATSDRLRAAVAIARSTLADALAAAGDVAGARRAYEDAVHAFAGLAERLPLHVGNELAAESSLSTLLFAAGETDEALRRFEQLVARRREQVAADPRNAREIHNLATELHRLALAQAATGLGPEARTSWEEVRRLTDGLLDEGAMFRAAKLRAQAGLRLGLLAWLLEDDLEAARASLADAVARFEALLAQEPNRGELLPLLAETHLRLADVADSLALELDPDDPRSAECAAEALPASPPGDGHGPGSGLGSGPGRGSGPGVLSRPRARPPQPLRHRTRPAPGGPLAGGRGRALARGGRGHRHLRPLLGARPERAGALPGGGGQEGPDPAGLLRPRRPRRGLHPHRGGRARGPASARERAGLGDLEPRPSPPSSSRRARRRAPSPSSSAPPAATGRSSSTEISSPSSAWTSPSDASPAICAPACAPPRPPARPRGEAIEAAIEAVLAAPSIGPRGPVHPSPAQVEAMRLALRAPLSVITGGPGTGKTAVVVSLLRAYARLRGAASVPSIALAAPTGKAADRMRSSIRSALASVPEPSPEDRALLEELEAPRTLHRLLAYSARRGRFLRTAESPLPERLVVVDEGSMIDLFLMQRLLSALAPEARLVLLGDADQLPSVAAGAVFRELAEAEPIASVRLLESHRMNPDEPAGANILRVAEQLKEGQMPLFASAAEASLRDAGALRLGAIRLGGEDRPASSSEEGVSLLALSGPASLGAFLDRWFGRFVLGGPDQRGLTERTWPVRKGAFSELDQERLRRLFAALEGARLLAIRRVGRSPRSVRSLNEALHRRLARERRATPGSREAPILLPGEPVIVARNDYPRQLWNGDQGVILRVASERGAGRRAVFRDGDGFVVHDLRGAEDLLELGFATTVHKAQGSEHERIALVLPEEDAPRLMTREILYTALTRARRGALVLGDPEILRQGIARRVERQTGLRERLAATDDG